MTSTALIARCSACGAAWDLDYDPVACECDYADPEAQIEPWTLSEEIA